MEKKNKTKKIVFNKSAALQHYKIVILPITESS